MTHSRFEVTLKRKMNITIGSRVHIKSNVPPYADCMPSEAVSGVGKWTSPVSDVSGLIGRRGFHGEACGGTRQSG